MLGGAGGAYNALYTDYKAFLDLLLQFLKKYPFLSGIDLDIEEELDPDPNTSLDRVKQLINDISAGTTKDFAITKHTHSYLTCCKARINNTFKNVQAVLSVCLYV